MSFFEASGVTVEADARALVAGVSFTLKAGEFTALIGPNGAGKTTLMRACLHLIAPTAGASRIEGEALSEMAPAARARRIAYLPQTHDIAWPIRARDAVALGRFAYGGAPGRLNPEDDAAIDEAMARCRLAALADRPLDRLSGGEKARVACARALAAKTGFIFADEPTAALDPRERFRILDLLAEFARAGGGALVILHDLDLAARYATRLLWMDEGRLVADGPPSQTMTAARLREIYSVEADVAAGRVALLGPASRGS